MPAFDEAAARAVIARELPSVKIGEVFKGGLPSEPVAAASLGQVYRVTMADGSLCALKVQRPDMEATIALDMHLLRDYAAPLASALGGPGDPNLHPHPSPNPSPNHNLHPSPNPNPNHPRPNPNPNLRPSPNPNPNPNLHPNPRPKLRPKLHPKLHPKIHPSPEQACPASWRRRPTHGAPVSSMSLITHWRRSTKA